jgi:hypothetical protein
LKLNQININLLGSIVYLQYLGLCQGLYIAKSKNKTSEKPKVGGNRTQSEEKTKGHGVIVKKTL